MLFKRQAFLLNVINVLSKENKSKTNLEKALFILTKETNISLKIKTS